MQGHEISTREMFKSDTYTLSGSLFQNFMMKGLTKAFDIKSFTTDYKCLDPVPPWFIDVPLTSGPIFIVSSIAQVLVLLLEAVHFFLY